MNTKTENSNVMHSLPGYIHLDILGTVPLAMLEPITAPSDKSEAGNVCRKYEPEHDTSHQFIE